MRVGREDGDGGAVTCRRASVQAAATTTATTAVAAAAAATSAAVLAAVLATVLVLVLVLVVLPGLDGAVVRGVTCSCLRVS